MSANSILVFSENISLVEQLLGEARRQADQLDWQVAVVGIGPDVEALTGLGADRLYQVDGDLRNPESVADALSAVATECNPGLCMFGATKLGMEVAPRLAERMDAGYAAWATGLDLTADGAAIVHCMQFTGTAIASYTFAPGPIVITVASGVFQPKHGETKATEVISISSAPRSQRLKVMGHSPKSSSRDRLEEAKFVLDIGQGVKERDDLKMLQELANQLGGQLACTRPLASDRDWFPDWLGLSGAKIKPELCLMVGVSGAIQHVIGVRDSRVIAAVNVDEGAAIFMQADYGVVADLYTFLPALGARLKARGISTAW